MNQEAALIICTGGAKVYKDIRHLGEDLKLVDKRIHHQRSLHFLINDYEGHIKMERWF
jgi:hypothetical protein